MAAAFVLATAAAAPASVWHVDASAAAGGDGTTWMSAFAHLQDALNHPDLAAGDQIWLAEGVYFPDRDDAHPEGTDDPGAWFALVSSVAIYGGFPAGGGDGVFADRDTAVYRTVLSGDLFDRIEASWAPCDEPHADARNAFLSTPGVTGCTDRSCCTLVCEQVPYCCAIQWDDLCVLAAGDLCVRVFHVVHAFGVNHLARLDGVTITGGRADGPVWEDAVGGGLVAKWSSPSVVRCTFTNNVAGEGGAMLIYGGVASPKLVNCRFTDNQAALGGAVSANFGNPVFTNCVFRRNIATGTGGAIHGMDSGAAVYNCTFTDNLGATGGGATFGIPQFANVIAWDNVPDQIASAQSVTFSCVQGGHDGAGNIDVDPQFDDPANGDVRLAPGSPCIDLGSNQAIPTDAVDLDGDLQFTEPTPLDLDLGPRVVNGTVDLGAYETCRFSLDLDGDGVIGILDFLGLLGAWGTNPGGPPDFDGDGAVGVTDLLALLAGWGPC